MNHQQFLELKTQERMDALMELHEQHMDMCAAAMRLFGPDLYKVELQNNKAYQSNREKWRLWIALNQEHPASDTAEAPAF